MLKRLSRRRLAIVLAAPAAAAAQASAPGTPEAELQAAREALRRRADVLAKFAIPMDTEPACIFRA